MLNNPERSFASAHRSAFVGSYVRMPYRSRGGFELRLAANETLPIAAMLMASTAVLLLRYP
jgi:hypothetical protein